MATADHTAIQLPLAIDGATVEIPLTQGYVTTVDEVDADLAHMHWHTHESSSKEYARLNERRGRHYMHRIILSRILGRELARLERVDHIDLDGLNNRRRNLRLATDATNGQNRGRNKNNASGYKGVSYDKRNGKWVAQIDANGKHYPLGRFDTAEQAYEAYCAAAKELHGAFARVE